MPSGDGVCPACHTYFQRIHSHFSRTPQCRDYNVLNAGAGTSASRAYPPIPSEITTSVIGPAVVATAATTVEQQYNAYNPQSRSSSKRRGTGARINYSESGLKSVPSSDPPKDTSFPVPDEDLLDYVTTYCGGDDFEHHGTSSHRDSLLALGTDRSEAAVAARPLDQHGANSSMEVEELHQLGVVETITMEEQNGMVVATPQDRSMARIYRMFDAAGSPRYLADSVIRQLRKEIYFNQFDPCHTAITQRDAFMGRAYKSFGSERPEAIPVTLETGQKVTVFRFSFLQTLQQHLLSTVFSDLNNLSVDTVNPWGEYAPDMKTLKDAHDGTWYRSSYKLFSESVDDPSLYCFSPLFGYVDKTGTDGIEKNTLEPFMLISSTIRQGQREDNRNWFPVGFIPNLVMISAAARRGMKGRAYSKSAATRDYHRCLQVLLEPLREMQKNHPPLRFRRGDQIKRLRMVCPLAGIVGDNKSQDTLGGRVADYGETTPRLSRRCLTEFGRSANSLHSCVPVCAAAIECLTMGALSCVYGVQTLGREECNQGGYLRFPTITLSSNFDLWKNYLASIRTKAHRDLYKRARKMRQKLCEHSLRQVFGSHSVDNAFFGMDFGSNSEGIFKGTLADILHTIEEGAIPKLLKVVFGMMGDTDRTGIDSFVQGLFCDGHNRSSERNSYPRVSFTRGYTQLTKLSANERVGQLFVLSLMLQTKAGRLLLAPRFEPDFDAKRVNAKEHFNGKKVATDSSESGSSESSDSNSTAHEDMDPFKQSPDGEGNSNDGIPRRLDAQLSDCLDRLDLSYMHTGIYPFLDLFHRKRLDGVIRSHLNDNFVHATQSVSIPKGLLDYRDVDRPTELLQPGPHLSVSEIEHADFRVTEGKEEYSIKLSMDHFVYLVETLLSLISFLKYGCNLLASTPSASTDYDRAIELFLRVLPSTIDRGDNTNQWCLQKTLEIVHFKMDVLSLGPASGFSTETGERGLKLWAKGPATTAQKRGDEIFSGQVCERIHEKITINAIADCCPLDEETTEETVDDTQNDVGMFGANFVFETDRSHTIRRFVRHGKMHKTEIEFPEAIVAWFAKTYGAVTGANTVISLFTEAKLPSRNDDGQAGVSVRAHPNYRGQGAWYDYALVEYDETDRDDNPVYPCKIVIFFEEPHSHDKMALVQEVDFQTGRQQRRESQLFHHWTLRSKTNRMTKKSDALFTAIPLESLTDRIYVIDPCPIGGFTRTDAGEFDVLVVKFAREQWPLSFLKSPYYFRQYSWG
jgi:hypothetical protein